MHLRVLDLLKHILNFILGYNFSVIFVNMLYTQPPRSSKLLIKKTTTIYDLSWQMVISGATTHY